MYEEFTIWYHKIISNGLGLNNKTLNSKELKNKHVTSAVGKNSMVMCLSFTNLASLINEYKSLDDKIVHYLSNQ